LNKYYYNKNNETVYSIEIQFNDYAHFINDQKKYENYEKQFLFYKEMFSSEYEILDLLKN